MSGDVYETAVVDSYHSSNSIVIYKKDRRRKERLGDNILLRFMNPTSAYKMVIKTTPLSSLHEMKNYRTLMVVIHNALWVHNE